MAKVGSNTNVAAPEVHQPDASAEKNTVGRDATGLPIRPVAPADDHPADCHDKSNNKPKPPVPGHIPGN